MTSAVNMQIEGLASCARLDSRGRLSLREHFSV